MKTIELDEYNKEIKVLNERYIKEYKEINAKYKEKCIKEGLKDKLEKCIQLNFMLVPFSFFYNGNFEEDLCIYPAEISFLLSKLNEVD